MMQILPMVMENTLQSKERFKGVPLEMLCDIAEVQRELNLKDEGWTRLVKAGMPILVQVGNVGIGWTTDVIEWMKTRPELPPLPSTVRKQRQRKRKERR